MFPWNKIRIKPLFIALLIFVIILDFPFIIDAVRHGGHYNLALLSGLVLPFIVILVFKLKPFHFVLLSFPVLLIALIFDVQVLEYRTYVNISTWSSLFDTYTDEAMEFSSGLHLKTKLLMIFQILTYVFFLFYTYGKPRFNTRKNSRKIAGVLLLVILADFSFKGSSQYTFPLRGSWYLIDFGITKYQQKSILAKKNSFQYNARRSLEFNPKDKETILIVIGESLRRDHLEYYGHPLPTTPYIKNENIIVYTDVVSAANQTINALKRVFTPVEHLDEKAFWDKPSFIKTFKETGFKTYWLTNQQVYGRHESQASFIATETDKFIANKPHQYDEVLMPELAKVLQDTAHKKLIFLHLMGNHAGYKYRYPKVYNYFHPEKTHEKKQNFIKHYDNAVRYNDYVLSRFLELLKKQEGEKSFIMFSDHAESLFDAYPDYAYHGSEKPSKSEVEIPLILWFSKAFKEKHSVIVKQVIKNKDLPVISYDFYHSFPGLFGIQFDGYKAQNNIFDKSYQPKKQRKIINVNLELLDYDGLK